MARMQTKRSSTPQELATLLGTGASYWLYINPLAKREIAHWRRLTETIPNDTLRYQALHKLTQERLNPEAAALFAVTAGPLHRKGLIRLIVAFQIAYDYLDAINEAPDTSNLQNGFWLHRALEDAVALQLGDRDYYRHHPHKDDGHYLATLIDTCRTEFTRLHCEPATRQIILTAIRRVGAAQTRNHAVGVAGEDQLIEWAQANCERPGYLWWELAAGGISSLGVHALFAATASKAPAAEAKQIDAAYFPAVCAISALLDSLVDYTDDAKTQNHSFVAHYTIPAQAARRFGEITAEANTKLQHLRCARQHTIILAGIASFYLSAHQANDPFATPIATSTLNQLSQTTRPMLATIRHMRHQFQRSP